MCFIKILFGRHRGWRPFCDSDEGFEYISIKCLETGKGGKEFLNKMWLKDEIAYKELLQRAKKVLITDWSKY
jgi:hypothetical protein